MYWLEGERRDGLIADKEGWNYHIDVISKENLQFPIEISLHVECCG
jgi:hypothetical protein